VKVQYTTTPSVAFFVCQNMAVCSLVRKETRIKNKTFMNTDGVKQ